MAYFRSGAGGTFGGAAGGAVFNKGNIYGFLKQRLIQGHLFSTFYHSADKKNWQTWDAPVVDLKGGREIFSKRWLGSLLKKLKLREDLTEKQKIKALEKEQKKAEQILKNLELAKEKKDKLDKR